MNERIKILRKALDLTQQKFADNIGVKRNTVATYEMGRSIPSDSAISLICKTFNVNEKWLRTGEGEMFVQPSRDDELISMVDQFMSGESASFKKRLISVLSNLEENQWMFLERKLKEIVDMTEETSKVMTPEEEARAEAEQYYQELLQEKRAAAGLLASPDVKEA